MKISNDNVGALMLVAGLGCIAAAVVIGVALTTWRLFERGQWFPALLGLGFFLGVVGFLLMRGKRG